MAPLQNNEMLDELAVECMDLQVLIVEEANKSKHKDLVKNTIDRIITGKRFQRIPDFEDGKNFRNIQSVRNYELEIFQASIGSTFRNR